MNPYLSITTRTFTIWLMASAINGLLYGIYIGIAGNQGDPVVLMIFLAAIGSLFFAAPGFFIFWMVMLSLVNKKVYGRYLFRAALLTGIILSATTAFLARGTFREPGEQVILIFIVLSALTSIMMHFNHFKKIGTGEVKKEISIKISNQNKSLQ